MDLMVPMARLRDLEPSAREGKISSAKLHKSVYSETATLTALCKWPGGTCRCWKRPHSDTKVNLMEQGCRPSLQCLDTITLLELGKRGTDHRKSRRFQGLESSRNSQLICAKRIELSVSCHCLYPQSLLPFLRHIKQL